MSYFERTFNHSSDLESKFLKRVRFRISLFNTRQNLNRKFYNASDFEGQFFLIKIKIFEKIAIKKPVSLCHFTLWKQQGWHFRAFSQILIPIIFCEKEYILSIKFFEQLHILNHVFEHVVFRAFFSKFTTTLIENLRTCQKIEFSGEICVQRIICWVVLKR